MTIENGLLPPELQGQAARHAVYRCYSDLGELLYVGTSGRFGKRLAAHAEKAWFLEVRGITLEWYASELEATKAERRAIHVEHPKYNVLHKDTKPTNPPPRRRVPTQKNRSDWPKTSEVSEAVLARRISAAAARWEAEHGGRQLPALRLAEVLRVRMSRDTATRLLAKHYSGGPR
jgi:hypothetical protein